ncbi:MAG TPA: hypothetical protein VKU41_30335 [Polyangiaceae bacterium]|nr:hypothetical protein [Polyangiaceae bacterium]
MSVPTTAWAGGGAFGGAGQLAITDDQPLGAIVAGSPLAPTPPSSLSPASFEFGSVSDNGGSGTAFALAPSVDYFPINGLSVGASFVVGVLNPAVANGASGGTETIFGIVPRVGYDLPLSEFVSFWPKVYFGYVTYSVSGGSGPVSVSGGGNQSAIGLFAPFMFEPARHFLLGIGPSVSTQLGNNTTTQTSTNGTIVNGNGNTSVSNPKVTLFGLQATIGGWFLGD